MTVPAYPEYKDSGVAWLGAVPSHWEVTRLKQVCEVFPSNVDKKSVEGEAAVLLCNYTDVYYNDAIAAGLPFMEATASDEQIARFTLRAGDTIITKDSETPDDIARSAFVAQDMPGVICGYHLSMVRPKAGTSGAFIKRYFDCGSSRAYFHVSANGLTRVGLGQYAVDNAPIVVPPPEEQTAIATFLDRETAKIDGLVAEQERLIALLKEKRQAVISHAVTKGLNPDAPLKDSGIEWLGQIPAHWEVVRLGNLYREAVRTGSDELPILSVSIHRGVSDYEIADEDMERNVARSEDRSKYKRVQPNDLVYNMMRAWQGGFGTVKTDGQVSPAYVVAEPIASIRSEFVEALLRTPCAIEEMRRHSRGVTDFRLRLYWDEFKDIRIALPPPDEIDAILARGGRIAGEQAALEQISRDAITLLQERRAALISAAVTGKIDVRDAAAPSSTSTIGSPSLRAVVGCHVIIRFGKMGRMVVMKLGYLAEAHAGLDLSGYYTRDAAGPYDRNLRDAMESGASAICGIATTEPTIDGGAVTYAIPTGCRAPNDQLMALVGGDRAQAFDVMLTSLNGLIRDNIEAIATLYAVWNDLIAAGKSADDGAICAGVLNDWHPEKSAKFTRDQLDTWLSWMRRNGFVPSGNAPRTDHQGSLFT